MAISNLKIQVENASLNRSVISSETGTGVAVKMVSAEIIPTGEDYEMSTRPFNILFGEDAEISFTLKNGDEVTNFAFAKGFTLMADIIKVEANDYQLLAFI